MRSFTIELQPSGLVQNRALRTLGQHRSAQRKVPQGRADDIVELADRFGSDDYCRVTGFPNNAGWNMNHKRVEPVWRRGWLKVPQKQKKKDWRTRGTVQVWTVVVPPGKSSG